MRHVFALGRVRGWRVYDSSEPPFDRIIPPETLMLSRLAVRNGSFSDMPNYVWDTLKPGSARHGGRISLAVSPIGVSVAGAQQVVA